MKIQSLVLTRSLAPLFVVGVLLATGCSTTKHDVSGNDKPHDMPAMTPQQEADMKAVEAAGKKGPMHAMLAKHAGTWKGTSTMWMAPDAPAMTTEMKCVTTTDLDGRFTRMECSGDIPGMGEMKGVGYYGFDNVSQKFVSSWMSSCSTGIMTGEGTLGSDGKTITWIYKANCPIRKGPCTMRDVETHPTADTLKIESYCTDPHTGKEFKMNQLDMKRVDS